MTQLLSPAWWLGGFADGFVWWVACVVAALAATPLCLRLFRSLPDRGAGLAPAFSLYTVNAMGLFLGLGGIGAEGATKARLLLLGLALLALIVAWWRIWRVRARFGLEPSRSVVLQAFAPAALLGVVSVVALPHGAVTFWIGVVLLAAASAAAWLGDLQGLRRRLRTAALPMAAAHLLFLIGFVFFLNVRSYIPHATWEAGMSGAEKFGNLMHLASGMRATTLPPPDAWFAGEPANYYNGGHLMVGSIAQATGTEARFAFNYGLATIFALTLCTSFSVAFNFVQRTSAARRWRGIFLHRGFGLALMGAAAVTLFGNLDAWEQLLEREPVDFNERLEELLAERPGMTPEARTAFIVERRESPGLLRFTPANLASIDYWRSSRAVHGAPPTSPSPGTITEFPYFSAILGDLHAHHMAHPLFLLALAAVLQLMRRTGRGIASVGDWVRRAGGDLALMALLIGMACPVNIWDCIVLAPLYLLAIALGLRVVPLGPAWRWPFFAGLLVLLLFLAALLLNAASGIVPVFGSAFVVGGGVVVLLAGLLMARWESTLTVWTIGVPGLAACVAVAFGGYETARGLDPGAASSALVVHGLRDAVVFTLCGGVAALAAFTGTEPWKRWLAATLVFFGLCGVAALVVASPFLAFFHSPLQKEDPAFVTLLPPVLSPALFEWVDGFWVEFWARSPINPFPHYLRTTLVDHVTHWGIFLLPVLPLLALRTVLRVSDWREGRTFAFLAFLLALAGFTLNIMRYWVGPLALVAMTCCLALAWGRSKDRPLWAFLAVAFLYYWFCEALHFDDEYQGDFERYNTPFKIWYPLWGVMALAMVRSLAVAREWIVSPANRMTPGLRRAWRAAFVAACLALLALGLLYPWAATAMRTRHFHTDDQALPVLARGDEDERAIHTRRSLDALMWMTLRPSTRDDAAAIAWLDANATPGGRLLEAPPDFAGHARAPLAASYSPVGRHAAATGIPTLVGWSHHELQWRGWRSSVPERQARRFAPYLTLEEQNLLEAARVFFEHEVSLADIRLLKNLAAAPPHRREDLARLSFPGREENWIRLLVRALNRPDTGSVRTMDLLERLIAQADQIYESPEFDEEVKDLLRFHGIRHVIIGPSERLRYAANPRGLAKFARLEAVFRQGDVAIYAIPDDWTGEGGGS